MGDLPRRQTRVLTWPLVTVFGFIARPDSTCSSSRWSRARPRAPTATTSSTSSQPAWRVYQALLTFAAIMRRDLDRKPGFQARDMIDLQSFIWVQGSQEYDA